MAKEWKWGVQQEETFNNLKELLSSPPVLAYSQFDKPFQVHTDASSKGLGAVLYQMQQDCKMAVISYASRGLSKSEKNYSAFKLEFLALKWSITEKFRDYLVADKFTVYTDNPLTHLLTTAKLDTTGQRWVAALSDFGFDVVYRPGKKNTDADVLSRYPFDKVQDQLLNECTTISNQSVKAICNSVHFCQFVEILPCFNLNILDVTEDSSQVMAQIEMRELRRSQREDVVVGPWLRAVLDKVFPKKSLISSHMDHLTMSRHFDQF